MPSGWYRATVSVPRVGGLPADDVQNVWSFRHLTDADHGADATEIASRLTAFYEDFTSNLSGSYSWASATLKIFDLQETAPRVPFYEEPMPLTGGSTSGQDLPSEVALCLSFRGEVTSGVNPRRRRGRVYLGPWRSGSGADFDAVLTGIQSALVTSAAAELGGTTGDVEWCVYSPYTHHGVPVGRNIGETTGSPPEPVFPEVPANLFDSFTPVVHCWCDNAWDTQRRRGPAPSSRATATV